MLKLKVQDLARTHHAEVIGFRRHLHMHPELSFQEAQTSQYIREYLKVLEIPFIADIAGHGIIGLIEGRKPDAHVVALRADMDALPIQEQNDVPYRSRRDGIMHACGHDVHTASLMGAAAILSRLRTEFDGTVKLIFQPAEEKLPGGASLMIEAGALKDPEPSAIIGQHVHPPLEVGKVGFRSGEAMASADEITLRVSGKGGHGAMPHLTVDPVVIAAQIVTALQTIVSRSADPLIPTVLTFGKIASDGGAFNIIPDAVEIIGTFRTFGEDWRRRAHAQIRSVAMGIAEASGGHCEVTIDVGYPVLINDQELTARSRAAACEYLGDEHVVDLPQRLTSEDFAFYTHEIPGCFYRLGVGNQAKGITSSVHTPLFDIDEEALMTGAGLLAWLAITELA